MAGKRGKKRNAEVTISVSKRQRRDGPLETTECTGNVTKRKSSYLTKFMKVYKGLEDYHIPLFEAVNRISKPQKVFYPGSFYHLSASLVFSDVTYLDSNVKMKPFFEDGVLLDWVKSNKLYDDSLQLSFLSKNFESKPGIEGETFDLLISLSAGIVSKYCAKYLKKGGFFLAGDAHFDARFTFTRPDFELVGVYDRDSKEIDQSEEALKGHFTTTLGNPISKAQVEESINVPKARRKFKLQKEALFYLFKKVK